MSNKYRHQIEPIHCNYLANSDLINTKFQNDNISKYHQTKSTSSNTSTPHSSSSRLAHSYNHHPYNQISSRSNFISRHFFSLFSFAKTHNKPISDKFNSSSSSHHHSAAASSPSHPMLKRCLIRELTLTRRERNLWVFVVLNSVFLVYLVYYNPETSKAIIGQFFQKDHKTSSKLRKLKENTENTKNTKNGELHDHRFTYDSTEKNTDKMMQLLNNLNTDSSSCAAPENSYSSLLLEIQNSPYRNHSDFLTHDKFRSTWACLNEDQKLEVKIKLFDYPWNKPRIMERSDGTKRVAVRRFPDVICIGSKKCGTGALQFFMKLHPYSAFKR